MDLPRLIAMNNYWAKCAPMHVLVGRIGNYFGVDISYGAKKVDKKQPTQPKKVEVQKHYDPVDLTNTTWTVVARG